MTSPQMFVEASDFQDSMIGEAHGISWEILVKRASKRDKNISEAVLLKPIREWESAGLAVLLTKNKNPFYLSFRVPPCHSYSIIFNQKNESQELKNAFTVITLNEPTIRYHYVRSLAPLAIRKRADDSGIGRWTTGQIQYSARKLINNGCEEAVVNVFSSWAIEIGLGSPMLEVKEVFLSILLALKQDFFESLRIDKRTLISGILEMMDGPQKKPSKSFVRELGFLCNVSYYFQTDVQIETKPRQDDSKTFWTKAMPAKQCAYQLGVSRSQFYRLISAGELVVKRLGSRYRIVETGSIRSS